MIKKILTFISNLSFKRFISPYFKALLRVFFSDRKTMFLLKVFGSFFGVFRLLNALLGFLIFINLYNFKGIYSIPASMVSFMNLIKKEFVEALDKYFPNHPHVPGGISKPLSKLSHSMSDVIEHSPVVKDVVHKIADEANKVEHASEGKFESLRKIYSQYKPTWDWFWKPAEDASSYSLFSDWKLYIGMVILFGLTYWFFGESIKDRFSNSQSFNPWKRDDDYGRPANPQTPPRADTDVDLEGGHIQTPGSEFRRTWPSRMYELLQERFPWKKGTVTRDNPNLQQSDLPSAPTDQPVASSSTGRYGSQWTEPIQVSPSEGRSRGKSRQIIEEMRRNSMEEVRPWGEESEQLQQPEVNVQTAYMTQNESYVDPYARIRRELYEGQSVFPVSNDWGDAPDKKSERAIQHLINQFDAGEQMELSLDSDLDSNIGDTAPSLTADDSSVADSASIVDPDDSIENLTEFLYNQWD
uniref:Uncharacterized protein n=1 Tax=Ganoderma leucocontextum TaxID=1566825 RepID=A0A2S1WBG3_9APHY|nr:hypothetical protein [Ganoderma leucocontextum]AWJ63911.1 hypothetical protein [Ganoderma leucocontextum]